MTGALSVTAANAYSRQLVICVFADEKETTPIKAAPAPWSFVVELHSVRDIRAKKSGLMIGGYGINGTRCDANVPFHSIVQVDIDTEVQKDNATGRILKVLRAAPPLDDIRSCIDEYEWFAVSSHSHEPQLGVVKYRIVILPDRDIQPGEWEPLLEALDDLLQGTLDRAAWPWSQAFYLPSCSAKNQSDVFFVQNNGRPLPVDEFVQRGQAIIAARKESEPPRSNLQLFPRMEETPQNIDLVKSMLSAIDPDIYRPEWRQVCWAAMATGWACAETLIREWSMSGTKFTEKDFADVVRDFDPNRGTAFGTLAYVARSCGWTDKSLLEGEQFTGKGRDVTNGRVFARMFRFQLLHVYETGEWLRFDAVSGWLAAAPGEADRAAKEALAAMRHNAADRWKAAPDDPAVKSLMAHVERTSQARELRAMIEMAKSEQGMTVRLSDFDADPMLLGVANGVVDLRTGELLPVSPEVLASKRCNVTYDLSGQCPRFEQFLNEVQPDQKIRQFLQRWIGYCLTGSVDEQKFAFLHGHGANGKSVFIEMMAWLLGDYAHKIPTDMLMSHQRNPQGPSPEIVSLKGMRFVYANEIEEGRRLSESRVKELTGGDTLIGRAPYGKADINFLPTHKLVIAGNHKPEISDTSNGMWRRVILIPFNQTIPEHARDVRLLEKLKAEGPGILNWALASLREYRKDGLQIPKEIQAVTAEYRDEQDILGDWIAECCVTGHGCSQAKRDLYCSYTEWCGRNGHKPLAQGRLTRRLNERGYQLASDKRTVHGIAVKAAAQGVGGQP